MEVVRVWRVESGWWAVRGERERSFTFLFKGVKDILSYKGSLVHCS